MFKEQPSSLHQANDKKMNLFIQGALYNASQNISRLSLSNGNTPLYFSGLKYVCFHKEDNHHEFEYIEQIIDDSCDVVDQKRTLFFDDECINTGKSEDNSMVFGICSKN